MAPTYLDLTYTGPPFTLGSIQHLLPLGAIAALWLLIAMLTPRLSPTGREVLRWGLAVGCGASWLSWDLWQLTHGLWSVRYSLPLHLCTLSVPLSAVLLLTRRAVLYELLYFWGFAGATQALLTPDLQATGYNFPHFVYWIFWLSHGIILWTVVFAGAAWGYRPTWRSLGRVALITNGVLVAVGGVNWLTGGNYMFIARKPAYPTLLDFLGPWPWYIIPLELIGLLAFGLVYLPYALHDWRHKA